MARFGSIEKMRNTMWLLLSGLNFLRVLHTIFSCQSHGYSCWRREAGWKRSTHWRNSHKIGAPNGGYRGGCGELSIPRLALESLEELWNYRSHLAYGRSEMD